MRERYADVEEECAFCGERRGPHEFEDGLRCVYCAEAQDAAAAASDAEEAGSFDERHTCAHHGVLDCETCRERELEARGT